MKKVISNLIGIALLLLLPSVVSACSCRWDIPLLMKPVDQQIKIARKRSKAVFLGKVTNISVDEKTQTYRATFKIQNTWKSIDSEGVVVRGTTVGGICEYTFKVGENYLVYASDYDRATDEYGTSICTRTKLLANAEHDLKVLGKGKFREPVRTVIPGKAKHNNSFNRTRNQHLFCHQS